MKKYFPISVILGLFTVLVFIRNSWGDNNENQVVGNTSPQISQSVSSNGTGKYKDGTYTGNAIDFLYGTFQVRTTITNGKITDVNFLQYPNDNSTSRFVNTQAMPLLKSEAMQVQSASVDIVSGASDSSAAFQQSLGSALQKAS